MKNEYLFLSDQHRATVEAYKPDGITIEIFGIDKTKLWVVAYSLANANEDSAKRLSDINSFIMQYSPLVLSCESSEYFNKTLFPLVNELERKLRKLLYLVASISDNEKAKTSIKQLEEKDFGEIFDLLFIDQNFILNIKKRINADNNSEFKGQSKYTKAEMQRYLDTLAEQTLWDDILGYERVTMLRKRFRDVQTYRNDVMHAHNIDKVLFSKSRYLFSEINRELEIAITNLLGNREEENIKTKADVNAAISTAMTAISLSTTSDLANAISGFQLPTIKPFFVDTISALQSLGENATLTELLRNVTDFPTIPIIESIQKQAILMNDLMQSFMKMKEVLKPNEALQDSMRINSENLSHTIDLISQYNKNEYSRPDDEKQVKGNPNE
jgi:hypothetical protein